MVKKRKKVDLEDDFKDVILLKLLKNILESARYVLFDFLCLFEKKETYELLRHQQAESSLLNEIFSWDIYCLDIFSRQYLQIQSLVEILFKFFHIQFQL